MARIDYGQAPEVSEPIGPKRWKKVKRIHLPEVRSDFVKGSLKWVDTKYLNVSRKYSEGSKALVGLRKSSDRWGIIYVMEAENAS